MSRASSEFAISAYIRSISVDHAEKGLILMMLGIPISAIPIIAPAGGIIALIGVVWYLDGRGLFGTRQSNMTVVASSVFVLGLAFFLVGSVAYLLFVFSSTNYSTIFYWWYGNNALASALAPSLPLIFTLETTGTILTGLAYFLLTYHLQERTERALLWLALTANIILSVLEFSTLTSSSAYQTLVSFHSNFGYGGINFDDAGTFQNQVLLVGLLSLIPALIFAAACHRLYSRIHSGSLP